MKNFLRTLAAAAALLSLMTPAAGQEQSKAQLKWYGFIRTYYTFDTRESIAGTEELFYYAPKAARSGTDAEGNAIDLNDHTSFRSAALTSRLGLDVTGYEYAGWKMGAKIETDFYNGLSKTTGEASGASLTGTAVLRLRQAYATVGKGSVSFKVGQAWHPLAADLPDAISLNAGSPFNPFSRTPLVSFDWKITNDLSLTLTEIGQMQYTSTGPYGSSATYIRNGGYEFYAGANYSYDGLLLRAGVDVLSIVPRFINDKEVRVNERITTCTPFFYAKYSSGKFSAKFKTVYAQAGEHMNLNGGYGICGIKDDGVSYEYTPSVNSTSWLSLTYTSNGWQYILFGGYCKNLGTVKELMKNTALITDVYDKPVGYWFSKNSYEDGRLDHMWRLSPAITKSFGKLTLGIEAEITSATYGDTVVEKDTLLGKVKYCGINYSTGLYDQNLTAYTNCRIQGLFKYNF